MSSSQNINLQPENTENEEEDAEDTSIPIISSDFYQFPKLLLLFISIWIYI